MATIKHFEITCACGKKKLPFSIALNEDGGTTASTREFICPFSHSPGCGYPDKYQQVVLPGGQLPNDWLPRTIKKPD